MNESHQRVYGICDHHGLFLQTGLRLAESGAKVWYATPQDRRDLLTDAIVGDGLQQRGVFCTDDLWLHKNEIDTWVYPDVRHCGEQLELRSQGLAVWGAGQGMDLELSREFFLRKLEELGLDVPPYDVIVGLTNLRLFLKDKSEIYIKVSKWRGSWETTCFKSWDESAHMLDVWAVKFGGVKESIRFICFPKIDTDLEIGADTYCVDGQWPALMLHGIERKDEAYFAAVTPREKMPEQLLPIMEAFSPYLRQVQYRNQWSMEVRVKDPKNYFIDATTRGGLPSTASFLKAKNIDEVIYHGARGEFVEIDYGFKFSAEAMIKTVVKPGVWATAVLDPDIRASMMLLEFCEVNGQVWFPADEQEPVEIIGWLRATGNTPTEVAENLNSLADNLPDGLEASVEALAQVIREIKSENEAGITFTEMEMPDPEIVLKEAT